MKILFVFRKDLQDNIGGAEIQILKTKEYLEKLFNLHIEVCTELEKKEKFLHSLDPELVHIFDMLKTNEVFEYITLAKKLKKKVVLSPIFWDLSHAVLIELIWGRKFKIDPAFSERFMALLEKEFMIKNFLPIFRIFWKIYLHKVKSKMPLILKYVDLVLPNSEEEAYIIRNLFNIEFKYRVVFNAVDDFFIKHNQTADRINEDKEIRLITVGRIEPTKNQYNVIRAIQLLHQMGIRNVSYTLVGRIVNDNYLRSIRSLALKHGISINIIPHTPHEMLPQIYRQHHIHVLPSLRESPGLASLEALVSGCFIVVSNPEFAPVSTYFDKYTDKLVCTCNPYKPESIASCIQKLVKNLDVYTTNINNYLDDFPFRWEITAKQTYEAYLSLF